MPISKERAKQIAAIKDEDIDYSDIPELDEHFWKNAKLMPAMQTKKAISIRIDTEVLDWFKSMGRGYQKHVNNVLRHYMQTNKNKA